MDTMTVVVNALLIIAGICSACFIVDNTTDGFVDGRPLKAVGGVCTIVLAILGLVKIFAG